MHTMEISEYGNAGVYKKAKGDEQGHRTSGKTQSIEQEQHPSCSQNLLHYISEFCNRTTVHGFNYLGERGRTIPERIWWLITILVALYLCITLIIQAYQKWINSPVIVTFATSQTSIWKIPFPAVTICSEIKSRRSRFNYTDIYIKKQANQQITEQESREFEYMSLVCDTPPSLLNDKIAVTDERAVDFLMEVAPDYNETMFKVVWQGQEYTELTDLFTPIITNEGLCYTFNTMDRSELFTDIVHNYKDCFATGRRSDWSVDSGYTDDGETGDTHESYPRRTLVASVKGGLMVMFKVLDEDLDYICGDTVQGFKVILHHPGEVPRGRQRYFRVPLDQAVIAAIKPNMMTTAGGLRSYKPKDRRCYFGKEKSLKYYKEYNQQNCLNECLRDFTLATCGCVNFHMRRENSTPICSASKEKCVVDARATYLINEIKQDRKQSGDGIKAREDLDGNKKCECLPSCHSLKFDVETSQANLDWRKLLETQRQIEGKAFNDNEYSHNRYHFSRLILHFKDLQFITSERNELYGQTDFLASCGGLLGLFVGFSFTSVLEILYYLTLRLICNVYLFGRHYWSGAEELLESKEKPLKNKST